MQNKIIPSKIFIVCSQYQAVAQCGRKPDSIKKKENLSTSQKIIIQTIREKTKKRKGQVCCLMAQMLTRIHVRPLYSIICCQ